MHTNKKRNVVCLDAYSRVCLTAIAVLMTVLIIGLWADHAPLAGEVQAKGPFVDGGMQHQLVAMVKAQKQTIAKLDQLITVLKSGQVKVQVVNAATAAPVAGKGANNASRPAKKH